MSVPAPTPGASPAPVTPTTSTVTISAVPGSRPIWPWLVGGGIAVAAGIGVAIALASGKKHHGEPAMAGARSPGQKLRRKWKGEGAERAPFERRELKRAYEFFKENAGQRAVGALHLAKAEAAAQERGWNVHWSDDAQPDISWMDEKQRKDYDSGRLSMLCADLVDEGGERLGPNVCGVSVYGDREGDAYKRVIEAELASEAL